MEPKSDSELAAEGARLLAQGSELYRDGVTHVLAGYQLLEEQLKEYIGLHYDKTRSLIAGKIHFGYSRNDHARSPLGRLVNTFGKLCSNADLLGRLRAVVEHRDHVAHQALLVLYGPILTLEEYEALIKKMSEQADLLHGLMVGLVEEQEKL